MRLYLYTKAIYLLILGYLVFYASFIHAQDLGEPPIKVGVIQSLTGVAAEDGLNAVRSIQLASNEINAKGPLRVKLLIEDDQSQAKEATSAYNRLIEAKVDVIIGATWSYTTNAIIPLAKTHSLVTINTTSLPEAFSLSQGGGYAFCNGTSVLDEDAPFREFIKTNSSKTAAIISTGTSWGEVHRKTCLKIAEEENVSIIEDFQSNQILEGDWLSVVTRLRTKKPDIVALMLNKEDIHNFLRRAKEQRFYTKIFASKNAVDSLRLAEDKSIYEGICFSYNKNIFDTQNSFTQTFKSKFGESPRIYADNSYDALFLLYQAFQTAKSTNTSLRDALRNSRYQGLAGEYRYNPSTSFATGKMDLTCIKNGLIN